MATVAYLTDNHTAAPAENPRAFGAISDGWVVKNNSVLISDVTSAIADGPHNAFNHASTSGYDVTIDTGEAMVSGSPIGKDTTTTVTLASSTTGQTVYVGSEPQTQDSVVVGLDADFTATAIRIPIWEFDTGSSTVTASTDLRDLGSYVNVPNRRYERSDGSGVAVDNASQLGGVNANNYARTDQSTTFGSGIEVATTAAHVDLVETDNNDKTWRFEAQNGNFQVTEVGVATQLRIDPSDGGRVEHPNGGAFGANVFMNNNSLTDVNTVDSGDTQASILLNAGLADVSVQTGGGGGGVARIYDTANSQPIADFNEGGGVKFPNGDLETRRGWMVDHSSPITIEKNGTDGNGVINFKTQ